VCDQHRQTYTQTTLHHDACISSPHTYVTVCTYVCHCLQCSLITITRIFLFRHTVITSEILMPNSRCQIHHKYIDHLSALYVTRHQQIYKTHSTAHKQEISERCANWQTNKSGFKITKRVAQNNQNQNFSFVMSGTKTKRKAEQ